MFTVKKTAANRVDIQITGRVDAPMLLGVIQKFDKCAVLADATWLKAVASVEGALIPGLTIKAFDLDNTAAAEAWLSS